MRHRKSTAPRAKAAGKKTKSASTATTEIVLEIALHHLKPRIWRTFVVPSSITLNRLHDVIQVVMGWTDSHLHSFHFGADEYGVPDDNFLHDPALDGPEIREEQMYSLRTLIKAKGDAFDYAYDFGDSWQHTIKMKEIRLSAAPL